MVLSALVEDDTDDVLLFARMMQRRFRARAVGGLFGTVLFVFFDDDTQDVLLFA